ncbi:LAFA_0F21968g1_1 [Lachancea sp. 'fantastica']|nr:LAFA_0F21968g1_1 [Lachancea sp. 'fantastica']
MRDSNHGWNGAENRQKNQGFKPKNDQSSTFDDGLFDKLQEVLNTIDLVNDTASNDYKPVISFFNSRFPPQLTQSWSYHAQVNNHAKFTNCTSKLAKALRVLGSDASTLEYGSSLIRSILHENVKVLYRGLNNMKPATTNSVLRLMRQIVAFNHGQYVDDFLTYFDLALPSLVRILTPIRAELADPENCKTNPDMSMRYNFLTFWLTLIENANPILRKAVLTENSRIMSTWFKHMTKVDSIKLMKHCVSTLMEKVLREKSMRRVTKCKTLNEFFISKLHFFYRSTDVELVKAVDEFFELYSTVDECSVAFSDDKVWFSEPVYAKAGPQSQSSGAMVMVNNKKFYLYNKLLFTMLTFFKPWEDETQLNRVIQVLHSVPELVAPYCTFLNTLGSHEPKMTSYWFGMTLLLGRIINLPIPQKILDVQTDEQPVSSIVMESIAPSSLTRASLTKALLYDVPLIKQMACQLLIFSFKKLEQVFKLYDDKGWTSAKTDLVGRLKLTLPELPTISATLEFVSRNNSENKILAASVSLVLNHYSKLFPLGFALSLPHDNIYSKVFAAKSFSALDLVIIDNFLQFQELNNSQTKWYNPNVDENSTFTTLLKLASSTNTTSSLIKKITSLLDTLLKFTPVFNENLIASPTLALINCLQIVVRSDFADKEIQQEKVWKLLDETVSRTVKTPYKYVDNSATYGYCSPFLVALVEQYHYTDTASAHDAVLKWLLIFARSAVFIGEPLDGVKHLMRSVRTIPEALITTFLTLEQDEETLNSLRQPENLVVGDLEFSFFQLVTLTPELELDALVRYPVNDLDVAGLFNRLLSVLSQDEAITSFEKFSFIVDNLLSKLMSYALSQTSFKSKLVEERFFVKCMVSKTIDTSNSTACEKYAYVSNSIISIYSQLGETMTSFRNYVHDLWITCAEPWRTNEKLSSVLKNGLSFLTSDQLHEILQSLLAHSQRLLPVVVEELYCRKIQITNKQFMSLLMQHDSALAPFLRGFIKFELVKAPQYDEIVPAALQFACYKQVIEEILKIREGAAALLQFVNMIKDEGLMVMTAAALSSAGSEIEPSFLDNALSIAFENLRTWKDSDLDAAIKLFDNNHDRLSDTRRREIVDIITTRADSRFTPQVPNFIAHQAVENEKGVRSWIQLSLIFITKNIVERAKPTERFSEFVKSFLNLHDRKNLWSQGFTASLNSQVEAIVSGGWVTYSDIMEYLNKIILGAAKAQLSGSKMLQLLLNNDKMCFNNGAHDSRLKFLTASSIFILFNADSAGCSNPIVQEKLLQFYGGTISPSDRMILNILEQIESKTLSSWTNRIFAWDYQDVPENFEENTANNNLIVKEQEGFIVTIRKNLVNFSVDNFALTLPRLPSMAREGPSHMWAEFVTLREQTDAEYTELQYKVYDPMFLLLAIVSNEELFRSKDSSLQDQPDTSVFDMKKVVDSGLLEFIVMCLATDTEVGELALLLVYKMLDSLEVGNFRDKHAYKLFLTKIAFTFYSDKNKSEPEAQKAPPLIWYMAARLSTVLGQPSSFLYEKANRWVLASPSVNSWQLPLYETAVLAKRDDDADQYYRYLHWFLESIQQGLKTDQDLNLLRSRGLLEWIMNLLNSPYITLRVRSLISLIIYKIQRLEAGGPSLLTRHASASFLENLQIHTQRKLLTSNAERFSRAKNKLHLMQNLVLHQCQINYSELGAGLAVVANSRKRLVEWMEGDSDNFLKRIHPSD